MKKLFLTLLIILCFCSLTYAAPAYGPRMPQQKQIFIGLQTFSVFKRHLENDYGKIRSLQNFFLISYGIFDWFSIDAKGGVGDIRQRPETGNELKYDAFLGGGYGFRIKFYDADKTKMIFGFQHISIHPHTVTNNNQKNKAVLDNWQFSLLASREIFNLTPYIGCRWSRMDNIHWVDTNRKMEKSDLDKSAGLILGMDIPISKKMWFNIEGGFFDETSVAGSFNFAF
ncbi:MAG: hypothetical protein Q8N14_07035 [Candidatus Omnitrophota bacterium]|nr:hypothetical protein [Candidatus Omnitrophota bacterium]